jgi:predicted nucleotidyltransferase
MPIPPSLATLAPYRDDILRLAKDCGAFNIRIFGSVARNEARPGSDVDFLVDFAEGASMWDIVRLWQELNELLVWEVNVIAADNSQDRFMKQALQEAIPL